MLGAFTLAFALHSVKQGSLQGALALQGMSSASAVALYSVKQGSLQGALQGSASV